MIMHAYFFQILISTLLKIFHVINVKFQQLVFEFSNIEEQGRIPPYGVWSSYCSFITVLSFIMDIIVQSMYKDLRCVAGG